MLICGFQKMTLLDFPNRVACTVFTGGCNLRCPFCHNALLVTEIDTSSARDPEEILSFLNTRKKLLDGVCITGGEPLLQKDIREFIIRIKEMGFAVKLDTNGCFPDRLMALVNENLIDYVAMDIKNTPEKYATTVGIENFDITPVETSIDFLLSGRVDYEFRTTVIKEFHTVQDIETIAERISGAKAYFLQNFVDSGNLIGENLHPADKETLIEMRNAANKFITKTELRGI